MSHIVDPVPWQNWMAAYVGYTLRMKMLFRGWPIMVHDTHTRRRRRMREYVLLIICTSVTTELWLCHALCDVCLVLCCSMYPDASASVRLYLFLFLWIFMVWFKRRMNEWIEKWFQQTIVLSMFLARYAGKFAKRPQISVTFSSKYLLHSIDTSHVDPQLTSWLKGCKPLHFGCGKRALQLPRNC